MAKKEYEEPTKAWTPTGFFSYPHLAEPHLEGKFADKSYKVDLLVPKAEFKAKGKEIVDAVNTVGKAYFGDKFKIESDGLFYNPFKDMDEVEDTDERMAGHMRIRAKAKPSQKYPEARQPLIIGPRLENGRPKLLTPEEIKEIKGGDFGKIRVVVYAYGDPEKIDKKNPNKQGVALSLRVVQFWKTGEGFGGGAMRDLEGVEELEVPLDAVIDEADKKDDMFG